MLVKIKEDVKYVDLRDTVDSDCTICYIEDLEIVLSYIEQLESNKIETISKDFHNVLDKYMANFNLNIPNIKETIDIQSIEELQELKLSHINIAEDISVLNRDKINELIKAIKYLDNKIK